VAQEISAQEVKSAGKTGDICQASGPYYSGRNAKVTVFFKKGQKFPSDADGSPTTWTLVSESKSDTR